MVRPIRTVVWLLMAALLMISADAQTTEKKPVKKAAAVASKKPVGGRRVVVTRKKVNGRWVRVTQSVKRGPSYQARPDTDRYQQIQQALATNGYFKGEANGKWGDDSVAALKQFQTDRKINNDGKISALSLIGLGLGPNREPALAPPAAAATAPPTSN